MKMLCCSYRDQLLCKMTSKYSEYREKSSMKYGPPMNAIARFAFLRLGIYFTVVVCFACECAGWSI